MEELDKRDKALLVVLQQNSRASLKELAQHIHLSLDATKKRITKLTRRGIIHRFGIFIDPKMLGYDLVVNVQIRLHNISEEALNKFIGFLKEHKNVIELITTLGEYDVTCVIIAKNTEEFELLSRTIRHKFKDLIADWKSVINLKVHKFEEYTL